MTHSGLALRVGNGVQTLGLAVALGNSQIVYLLRALEGVVVT